MASELLLQQLNYEKPHREDRLRVGLWVIDHPEHMEDLVMLSLDDKAERSMQAMWGLEFVCRYQLELLYPHFDAFFTYLPTEINHSRLRALSFICELIAIACYKKKCKILGDALTDAHKKIMTECCFDWMITHQKVACKVRAMTALAYLGTEFPWIHGELEPIIRENMSHSSAGYKARGKHVLKQIANFNLKN